MAQLVTRIVTASALLLGIALSGEASAQANKDQIVGAWTLVSVTLDQEGKKREVYGPNPLGIIIFDASGRFAQVITRPDLPKFASNNRETGTPEENKAVVQGSIAYFGTYSVGDGTIILHVESGTFPNWKGIDQKRSFTISGDELRWTNTAPAVGAGTTTVVWKRAK